MKKCSRPQMARHRRIVGLIRQGMQSGRLANASLFMREFSVSRATIMRDLDALRDDEGAPIEYDASRKGFSLSDPGWTLPPLRVSRREVFVFSVAAKLLGAFRGTPLDMDVESLFDKIEQSLEGSVTLNPGALTDRLSVVGEDYVRQDPALWSAVAEATDAGTQLEIEYRKFNGDVKTYLLEPYHLYFYHGNWYAVGMNRTGGRIATFAISRMRRVTKTGAMFEPDAGFDLAAVARDSFGIVRGEHLMRVRLLFSRNIAAYIRERIWHPTQQMRDKRDGSLELTLETAGWKELVRWILSWQPDVKVLAPKSLRDRVHEKMRAALANDEQN